MGFLRHLWQDIGPILFQDDELRQILRSQASWLKTYDILHTVLSVSLAENLGLEQFMIVEKKEMIKSLLI